MAKVFDLPVDVHSDTEILWNFHRLDHDLTTASVGIGLGSHDPGVATYTAELYHRGLFPVIVFSGANAPTLVPMNSWSRLPREASQSPMMISDSPPELPGTQRL